MNIVFTMDFKTKLLLISFNNRQAVTMNPSTLKRRLRDYGLSRRSADVSDHEVREIVQREMSGPGELRGYRAVWH